MRTLLTFSLLLALLCHSSHGHIGGSCNIFGKCLNKYLQPLENVICDMGKCVCREGFLKVSDHRCAEPAVYGGSCQNDIVCSHGGTNMLCSGNGVQARCECRPGYRFDSDKGVCTPIPRQTRNAPLLPLMGVILIAFIGMLLGCSLICYNFRNQPELTPGILNYHSRQQRTAPNDHSRHRSGRTTNQRPSTSGESHNRTESRASSKYDSLMFDEPPPNYEDAIKDYPSVIQQQAESNLSVPMISNNNNDEPGEIYIPLHATGEVSPLKPPHQTTTVHQTTVFIQPAPPAKML